MLTYLKNVPNVPKITPYFLPHYARVYEYLWGNIHIYTSGSYLISDSVLQFLPREFCKNLDGKSKLPHNGKINLENLLLQKSQH